MQELFRRFIGRIADQYATVLLVLGAVATVTYMVLITDIRSQEGNARLVKMSTEQGQLVEDINLLLIEKIYLTDANEIRRIDAKIISNLTQIDQNHASLIAGDRYIREGDRLVHVPGTLSQDLRLIYFDNPKPLDPQMRTYLTTVRDLYRRSATHLTPDDPELKTLLYTLSPRLLEEIGKASSIYQRQSEMMIGITASKQHMMFAISLASLIMVGTLLLQPLVLKLKDSAVKMRQEKAFADNVINTTQALIIGLDANAQVVLFNHYAEENSGWSEEEIKGHDFFEQFIPAHDQTELRKLFADMMSGEVQYADSIETLMRISTGDLLNIIWNPTIITDSHGTPLMFLATGLDITERKEAELQVKQANAELAQLSDRLQGEVNLAATLQRSILPQPIIALPGLAGVANLLTSSEVGGDYYDYYKVGGHHSILFIGDVSGHGVAAGTMVGAAKAGVYPLIHEGFTNPGEILNSLNINMQATAQQSLLMTMACLSLDARSGRLVFANAGHVLPYLLRKDAQHWEMIEASGLPLGKSLDSDYLQSAVEMTLNVGDKLFLYTDGLVEEESPSGEPFGYDRLEFLLNANYDVEDPEELRNILMDALRVHCRGTAYTDDITIVVISHTDRVSQSAQTNTDVSDIIRISEGFYRQGEHPIPRISKEYVVFLAEQGYSDLLTRFSQDGICRILPKNDDFCQRLGWEHLLNQHHESADDDLYALMPGQPQYRQFHLTHTEDKAFITEEIFSWLNDQGNLPKDHIEALMVILDEMTENSLYAAPRDGKGVAYYSKGESRELSAHEEVRIDIALADGLLGLMITDNWGTLTPGVFLRNIAHAMENGVEAGVGGVGLYMMWRLSDYLQIRVHPQKRTQVTTLWDVNNPIDMAVDSGIQFIYHTEYEAAYPVGA
ncbi:SpoIIE family protein phosphatase [Methylovulum psychrotolerans]|uniref:Diguanylate cyclase n=1 Tax=Methylovulum psychrotolerans TaxID=1704499 RepID=A0A1Z4C1L1_9GAMM|nr:SpoIIE family protein phosphatase [Methylovulum psychrotolerans]ASF47422.1 diguanylate cyclase [Methylovulum psychrotolerans]MBT9096290.1 SpoIIE family protein phosphatase [Methylovulum psychrotolerans]POZ52411.1 diguanylate cyclase [Methylovulum psychrotolerans]